MSSGVTRRDFVANAAVAGAAATLGLGAARSAAIGSAPAAPQRRASFDARWKFSRGDFPGAVDPGFDDRAWQAIELPHDWSIAGPYDRDAACGGAGGYLPTGIGWYRKSFALPPAAADRQVCVLFDGIYQRSEVWINGQPLGLRPYGYIGLAYNLTPHLYSGGRNNLLSVRVDNSLQPNSRWYSGSGITRHAWLVTTGALHIGLHGVWVRSSEISRQRAALQITTRIVNAGARVSACTLETTVLDASNMRVASASAHARIAAADETRLDQNIVVNDPRLWGLSDPQLYSLVTTVHAAGHPVDQVTTAFGIREARFDTERGFVLNGERIKLNGVCLHNDGGAVGAAVQERIWERRLALLKDMGCNAIRTSHNPPAPEFLDLCDSMGLLVMDEAFDEWRQPKLQTPEFGYHRYFDQWSARDLSDMIERDRNHPAVVIWSAGNEVPDQTDPDGPQTLQALVDILHRADPTRPVTVGCDNIAAEPHATPAEFLARLDVVGYNYVDRWRERREQFYSADRHQFPQRRFIGTESEAMGGVRGAYRLDDDAPVFGERSSNRRIAVEQLQKFVQTYDYVSGDFMWTGIDYLGEARWPAKLAASGVLDTCGYPKDGYYFYQSQWTDKPVLHLFPHWNWPGNEGQVITVMCYTNCDTVELLLDGKSLGVKGYAFPRPGMLGKYGSYPPRATASQTTADLHLAWDVPYAPGVLRAVGMRGTELAAICELRTTGAAAAIRLSTDRSRLKPDGRDVAHVQVEITDSAGLRVPTANDQVAFELRGSGRLIGVDNGQPDSHESYQARERRAFNGLALALIQSATTPGDIVLKASAPSLAGAQIDLSAL